MYPCRECRPVCVARIGAGRRGWGWLALLLGVFTLEGGGASLSAQQAPARSWRGSVDVGLDARGGGNTDLTIGRGGFSLAYLPTDRAEFELAASVRYGENQGRVIERQQTASLKLDLVPQNRWTPFAFTGLLADPISRRLDLRAEAGAGVKHTVARWDGGKASLSAAALLNLDRYVAVEGAPSPRDRNEARASWRLKFDHQTSDQGATFEHVSFFQPRWSAWDDYMMTAQSSVRTRLVGRVSMQLTHEYRHDATPPGGVARDDWSVVLSFRYDW